MNAYNFLINEVSEVEEIGEKKSEKWGIKHIK